MNKVTLLFAFLLLSGSSFSQIKTEEDMAKAVFETIQNNDLETFTSYCLTEAGKTKAIEGMAETTPKEKAIKQQLQQESVDNCKKESTQAFKALLEELKNNNIDLKKIELSETIKLEPRFEVTNLKAVEVKFEIMFNNIIYEISVDLFISGGNLYIYNFGFYKVEK